MVVEDDSVRGHEIEPQPTCGSVSASVAVGVKVRVRVGSGLRVGIRVGGWG